MTDSAQLLQKAALLLDRRRDFSGALEALESAIRQENPGSVHRVQALVFRGEVLQELRRDDDALTSFKQAVDESAFVDEPDLVAPEIARAKEALGVNPNC